MKQNGVNTKQNDEEDADTNRSDEESHNDEYNHHDASNYTLNGEMAIMNLFNKMFFRTSTSLESNENSVVVDN